MQLLASLLPLLTAAAATALADAPHALVKRCSPIRDPDLYRGYLPPAPCWQTFDPACEAHLARGTEQLISPSRGVIVVLGVSQDCFDTIREEQAREADGRKTYGWEQKHGKLTRVGDSDILVISNMTAETIQRYQALTY